MAPWARAAFWGWAGLVVSPPAWAQGVISAGPATYTIEPLHFDPTPAASFRGVSSPLTQDQVSEAGWWYRGLPFGPGDFTGGFQWSTVAIPPGAEQSYRVVVAVNTPAVPVELVGFAVE